MAVIDNSNTVHYTWGQDCAGWHFFDSDGLSIIKEVMPPGTAEVLHYHRKAQQFFFILSGSATFVLEGETHRIAAQQGIHVPPGAAHQIRNEGEEALTFLLVSSPKAQGDRVVAEGV